MHRFFIDRDDIEGDQAYVSGDQLRYIQSVLRMRPRDEAVLCDGQGMDYQAVLKEISGQKAEFIILKKQYNDAELPVSIYLFQCLPKGDKMDLIIQKTVELGVCGIIPVASKRCVVVLDQKRARRKKERWQEIALAAARQSGRGIIPRVEEVLSFDRALSLCGGMDLFLFPYEEATGMEALSSAILQIRALAAAKSPKKVAFLIGPEGGFAPEEAKQAADCGACTVSLGRRILRTETAGMAVMSVLAYEIEKGM